MSRDVRDGNGGPLSAYRHSIAGRAPLERSDERDLARRWRAGDQRAGARIIEACLPFVISIALEYRRWGVPIEDIVQQGNLGLLRATAKFDPERDVRLATYAAYWIRAEIREYVVRAFRVVRLGTTKSERRALRAYRKTRNTDPASLAAESGLSEERVRLLLPIIAAREVSLDASTAETSPGVERLSSNGPTPEETATRAELRAHASIAVAAAVKTLDERERLVVRERLMNEEPPTLQELGTRLGVSKERVRQIEERARGKLRGELLELAKLVA